MQTDADARICLAFKRQQEILSERLRQAEARGDTTEAEVARDLLRGVQDNELAYHQSRIADLATHVVAQRAPTGPVGRDLPKLPEAQRAVLGRAADVLAALRPARTASEHLVRGNAFYAAERFDDALEEYNAALALRPDHALVLHNRGATLGQLKRHKEALADFNRSLEVRPDHPDTLTNRAAALFYLNRYQEALTDVKRSLELRPDHPDTLTSRGGTLHHLKRYEEALADYNRSLELRTDDPATLNNRGITLRHLDRYEEALADLNRSLDLRPDHPATLYNRACVLSVMGRYQEALPDLAAAIAHDGKHRREAAEDEDFEALRNHPEWGPKFKELVETEE